MPDDLNPFGIPLPPDLDLARLLASSSGPVNWEIARFVAQAMAGDADGTARWSDVEDEYNDLVRAAEVQVQQYTGLSSTELLTPVEVVSRARWAEQSVRCFEPLVEPLAVRLGEAQAESAGAGGEPFANLMRALTPFMVGAQTGMLVGWLSHHVLGRFDVQLPPTPGSRLVFVAPNLEAAERSLNVVPRDFKFYIALREVVRAIEYAQPGVREQFGELAAGLVTTLEIDADKLEDIGPVDFSDPASMQAFLEDPSGLLASLSSPAQAEAVEKMEAFVGLVEGYADHVMDAVGAARIASIAEIGAAIEARSSERHDVEDMFEELLGFGVRRSQYAVGREFCDAVVTQEGMAALNRVWKDEASRPTLAELQEPGDWLARTVGRRG